MKKNPEHTHQQDISHVNLENLSEELIIKVLAQHGYKLLRHEPHDTLLATLRKELERGEIKLWELGLG